jgi:hypothetical protein
LGSDQNRRAPLLDGAASPSLFKVFSIITWSATGTIQWRLRIRRRKHASPNFAEKWVASEANFGSLRENPLNLPP